MTADGRTISGQGAGIEPRVPASAMPTITSVRLSPGDVVDLVNISRSGLLAEGRTRFVPGTSVTVHFDGGFKPSQAKGKIVRCQVSSVVGDTLLYQSAVQFDSLIDLNPGAISAAAPPASTCSSARHAECRSSKTNAREPLVVAVATDVAIVAAASAYFEQIGIVDRGPGDACFW